MFKIFKNHLSVCGIKFTLPEDFYIDIEGMEEIAPDGLQLFAPEKGYRIYFLSTNIKFTSAIDSLLDIFTDEENNCPDFSEDNETGYKWLTKPQKHNINGLECAYIKYETKRHFYYEIHFERLIGFDNQLEILLTASKEFTSDLDTVLNDKAIKYFYDCISPDI